MLPRALLGKNQLLHCKACGPKKESAQGGTCTRTGGALDAVPLLLGYLSMDKIGHPAGICPRICRLKAGRPVCLDDRVKIDLATKHTEITKKKQVPEIIVLSVDFVAPIKNGGRRRTCTPCHTVVARSR